MAGPVSLTLSTDVVPFAIRAERLEVLVVRQPGGWRLPGGSLGVGEHLDTAARRQLIEQTGLDEVYLEQLWSSFTPSVDRRGELERWRSRWPITPWFPPAP